jgi:hypothetical protein
MPFRVKRTAVYCMNYREETIKMLGKNTASDVKADGHSASGALTKGGNSRSSSLEVRMLFYRCVNRETTKVNVERKDNVADSCDKPTDCRLQTHHG